MKVPRNEQPEHLIKIRNGGEMKGIPVVGRLMPHAWEGGWNDVKNVNTSSEEWNVIVFNASVMWIRLEDGLS